MMEFVKFLLYKLSAQTFLDNNLPVHSNGTLQSLKINLKIQLRKATKHMPIRKLESFSMQFPNTTGF